MFVDDLGIEIAKREGLIDPLPKDKMPNLEKVYPRFIYNDGYGVALMISSAGIFYNTKTAKPLESYADMWDAKFAKKISLVTPRTHERIHGDRDRRDRHRQALQGSPSTSSIRPGRSSHSSSRTCSSSMTPTMRRCWLHKAKA